MNLYLLYNTIDDNTDHLCSPAKNKIQEQLTIIRAATIDNPATESSLSLLPEDASFYVDKAADPNELPVVRAAS
jgi:hypothetical protein